MRDTNELLIARYCLTNSFTLGALSINGAPAAYFTLEDAVREVAGKPATEWKLPGITAIPTGRYKLVIDESVRFKRPMPHILDVPAFTGVRIHGFGVEASVCNTEGCPLLGYGANIMSGTVQQSLAASTAFCEQLAGLLKVGECWITIQNGG